MSNLEKIVLTTEAEFDALAVSWRALENQVSNLLPFQTFDWNRIWWKIFSDTSLFHKDELAICALRDGEQLLAVMPLTNTHVGLHSLFVYRYVRPFGADPNLTEIRIPLALPGHTETILQLWEDLAKQETFGLTEFQVIHTKAQADHFLANNAAVFPLEERAIPNFILHLDSDWPNFKAGLKRNIKESLRHCYNSLTRDGLQARLQVLQGVAARERLEVFFALHAARAAATDTIEHPDYFATPQHRDFLRALLETGFINKTRLFCLELDGKIVAMRLAFDMGDELYLYYSGYDMAYARYSVMTTLVAEIIQWAIQQKHKRINLSVGDDVSKTRWGPALTEYVEYQCVKNNSWRRNLGSAMLKMRKLRRNWAGQKSAQ